MANLAVEHEAEDSGMPAMFAVECKTNCPHLCEAALRNRMLGPPPRGASAFEALLEKPCEECGDRRENWVCLHPGCGTVLCSRYVNGHFMVHCSTTGHCLGKSFSDLSVVCLRCEDYVRYPGPETTHLDAWEAGLYEAKFGPGSTSPTAAVGSSGVINEVVRGAHDPQRSADVPLSHIVNSAVQTHLLHTPAPDQPATASQLRNIAEFPAEQLTSASIVAHCTVCQEEMLDGTVARLPCDHCFHVSCVMAWFQRQDHCPTCREQLPQ